MSTDNSPLRQPLLVGLGSSLKVTKHSDQLIPSRLVPQHGKEGFSSPSDFPTTCSEAQVWIIQVLLLLTGMLQGCYRHLGVTAMGATQVPLMD